MGIIRATKDGLEKSKEEQLILDSENPSYKKNVLKNKIESELQSKSKKPNHILPLLIIIILAGVFIVLSSSGKKSNSAKKVQKSKVNTPKTTNKKNVPTANNPDKAKRLIELEKMLEKGLITEDEFRTLKANML